MAAGVQQDNRVRPQIVKAGDHRIKIYLPTVLSQLRVELHRQSNARKNGGMIVPARAANPDLPIGAEPLQGLCTNPQGTTPTQSLYGGDTSRIRFIIPEEQTLRFPTIRGVATHRQ